MFSKWRSRIAVAVGAALAGLFAQEMPLDPHSSVRVNLRPEAPLQLVTVDSGESRALGRGSALELDLHMGLTLRNNSPNTVRGVTLLVQAQEFTPGGRASVSLSSLNVGPGQTFTMPVEVKLLRPTRSGGPLVQVNLDGVLFRDLTFYGENRLDSRRSLTAYELEAQRDREYFKKVLAAYGAQGLQREVLVSLARQKERPRLDVGVTVGRGGRSVGAAVAGGNAHTEQFAFLRFPDSPVEPVQGSAQISGNEARSPNIQVRNRSPKNVRYVEIGWIVKDARGAEFMAASVPASSAGLRLEPGHTASVLQDTALRFTSKGAPVQIAGMTGFVSQVQYTDESVWIPNRASLENAHLLRVLAPSIEEQRLTDMYQRKGIKALVEELNKY